MCVMYKESHLAVMTGVVDGAVVSHMKILFVLCTLCVYAYVYMDMCL